MPGPIECAKDVLGNMSANGFTLTSFLSIIFTSMHFQIEMRELETGILPTILASQEAKVIRDWILKNARAIYMSEVQALIKKDTGLHMVAYKLCPEQLEVGQVSSLKNVYPKKAPELWKLCHQLLDVDSKTRSRWRAEPKAPNIRTPIPKISDRDGDLGTGIQTKEGPAERNYALLDIVRDPCILKMDQSAHPK